MRASAIVMGWLLLLVVHVPAAAQEPDDSSDAQEADPRVEVATAWLQHLDRGELEKTWETASPQSRGIFSRKAWISTLRTARDGLRAVEGRELLEVEEIPTPPGAPDGEYARVTFRTRFQSRSVTESVSLIRSDEEGWRVFGFQGR